MAFLFMNVCQLKNNVTVKNGGRVIFVVRPSSARHTEQTSGTECSSCLKKAGRSKAKPPPASSKALAGGPLLLSGGASCLKKAGRSKAKPTARRPAPSKPKRLLGALYSHGEKPLWFKLNKKKYVLVVLVLVAPPKLTNGKPVCKDFNK